MQHNISHYINKEMSSEYNSSASTSNVVKQDFDFPDFEELKECFDENMDQRDLERIEGITKDLMRECDEKEREPLSGDLERIEEIRECDEMERKCDEMEREPLSVATSGYVTDLEEYKSNEELKKEQQKTKDKERGQKNRAKKKRKIHELYETQEEEQKRNKRLKEQKENLEQQMIQFGIMHPQLLSRRIIQLASQQSTGGSNEDYRENNELYVELFQKLHKIIPETVDIIIQTIQQAPHAYLAS